MSHFYIRTKTGTITIVDVRRVFESFVADLKMIALRTRSQSQDWADKTSDDVFRFASEDFLTKVHVILFDQSGIRQCMKRYSVETDAWEWDGDRPGGNAWPQQPAGSTRVIISFSDKWSALSHQEQSQFVSDCHFPWVSTEIDISDHGMNKERTLLYGHNGYGLRCDSFRKV